MNATHSHTPPDAGRPVKFFSIEPADPARDFWGALARLLSLLAARARRRGESRR